MPKGRKPKTSDSDIAAGFLQPSREELRGAIGSLLHSEQQHKAQESTGVSSAVTNPTPAVSIAAVRCRNQDGNAAHFHLNNDALSLVIDIMVSQEVAASAVTFDANFQIVDRFTNIVAKDYWSRGLTFDWGTLFWVYLGNYRGPKPDDYTTPLKWGLRRGLYSFRAAVETPVLGLLCCSGEFLFRVV
jgi:hypothetical protein